MTKTILITGSTDGIGLATAKILAAKGHRVLLHGRSSDRLETAARSVGAEAGRYLADLSRIAEVEALAEAVASDHPALDVLINNAGVYKTPEPVTPDGLDTRFVVNTLAPYVLTRRLLPTMRADGRVVNLSSAAQAPVSIDALEGRTRLSDMEAYAQSKLAITMWSRVLAADLAGGQVIVAVNPGSLLASKMVKEGFGVAGNDIGIGADILVRAAFSDEFAAASGKYFDNDAGRFGQPHPDALDNAKAREVVDAMEALLARP
ncbi:SDR family NAD(P)-dependent oxidoreductase [Pikeienuella sp. HZG-20]|uniref:SDR family NAD(P)-dependent oxidoreductase n=1 Tax=Paludibacillus litoralis TaxID=3133267 RepID=UPI0030EC2FD9